MGIFLLISHSRNFVGALRIVQNCSRCCDGPPEKEFLSCLVFLRLLDFRFMSDILLLSSPRGLLKDLCLPYYLSMNSFFTGLKSEFGKITWLGWDESFGVAILVIIIAIVVAYYLGLLDAVFGAILKLIIS